MYLFIVETAAWIKEKLRRDGDYADGLHHHITSLVLISVSVVLGFLDYWKEPIECFSPAHMTEDQVRYINSLCWVQNTYYLPLYSEIPKEYEVRELPKIVYYQWIPLVMIAQAIFFYLPHAFWKFWSHRVSIDCNEILQAAGAAVSKKYTEEARQEHLKIVCKMIYGGLTVTGGTISKIISKFVNKNKRLFIVYICMKTLYFGNLFLQMYILGKLFTPDYLFTGWKGIYAHDDVFRDDFTLFPKVTMCDVIIRRLGNVQRYTVQCVLKMNIFNEKLYAVFWFWVAILFVITCLSFIEWCVRILIKTERKEYIKSHVFGGKVGEKSELNNFVDFMGLDGIFILHLISYDIGRVECRDIAEYLLRVWRKTFQPFEKTVDVGLHVKR